MNNASDRYKNEHQKRVEPKCKRYYLVVYIYEFSIAVAINVLPTLASVASNVWNSNVVDIKVS